MAEILQAIMSTQNMTKVEAIKEVSQEIFLPSVILYFIALFLLTMIIGLATVRKDRDKFWAIFMVTQIAAGIILFFTFIYPIIPQFISELGIF